MYYASDRSGHWRTTIFAGLAEGSPRPLALSVEHARAKAPLSQHEPCDAQGDQIA
jgi:hypothetical protein